jgi:hypothetical protein
MDFTSSHPRDFAVFFRISLYSVSTHVIASESMLISGEVKSKNTATVDPRRTLEY